MVQENLFTRDASKSKQSRPQPATSKMQAGRLSPNTSLQSKASENRLLKFQGPRVGQQIDNRPDAAHFVPRSSAPGHELVRLSGRVGRYFEVRLTQSGNSLATFSLATQRPYRDETGNWAKRTVWQRVVAWGQTADSVGQQICKGARVSVDGVFKTREWTDSENNIRTTTELVARHVHFLGDAAA